MGGTVLIDKGNYKRWDWDSPILVKADLTMSKENVLYYYYWLVQCFKKSNGGKKKNRIWKKLTRDEVEGYFFILK